VNKMTKEEFLIRIIWGLGSGFILAFILEIVGWVQE